MNRQIHTIFCDDIRQEVGGKLSYIGVYNGFLFSQSFPLTLPKFCLAINILTPASKPFTKLNLKITKDDEVMFENNFDDAQLSEYIEVLNNTKEANDHIFNIQFSVVFSPFVIDETCKLRVLADTDEGELLGTVLKIEQAPKELNS